MLILTISSELLRKMGLTTSGIRAAETSLIGTIAKPAMEYFQNPSHCVIGLIVFLCIRDDRSHFCLSAGEFLPKTLGRARLRIGRSAKRLLRRKCTTTDSLFGHWEISEGSRNMIGGHQSARMIYDHSKTKPFC